MQTFVFLFLTTNFWENIFVLFHIFVLFQEHHLQRAISAQQVYGDKQQLVIPTPETKPVDVDTSLIDDSEGDFKMPKQYIHIQG
jgi:hypothetical protein